MSPLRGRGARKQHARFKAETQAIGRKIELSLAEQRRELEGLIARIRTLTTEQRAAELLAVTAGLRLHGVPERILERIEADANTPIDIVIARMQREAMS